MSIKGNLDMKIGFWRGKLIANPTLKEQAEKEIAKLEIEKRALILK